MALSRRGFVNTLGIGAVGLVGGRILSGGRVIGPWSRPFDEALFAQGTQPLLLHNNENPLGPGDKALNAIRAKLTERGVPAARYGSLAPRLAAAVAEKFGCKPENVLVGCGSTQILRNATFAFTSPSRPLVGGSPTYEECGDVAKLLGAPIKVVPADSNLRHDIEAMAAAAVGAGLVFFDNPSNPAATLLPATTVQAFVEKVRRDVPRHGHPDRRGLSRLRDRPGPQDADSARARDAEPARGPHVLQGLWDGRASRRVCGRPRGHDQEAPRAALRIGHERARPGRSASRPFRTMKGCRRKRCETRWSASSR